MRVSDTVLKGAEKRPATNCGLANTYPSPASALNRLFPACRTRRSVTTSIYCELQFHAGSLTDTFDHQSQLPSCKNSESVSGRPTLSAFHCAPLFVPVITTDADWCRFAIFSGQTVQISVRLRLQKRQRSHPCNSNGGANAVGLRAASHKYTRGALRTAQLLRVTGSSIRGMDIRLKGHTARERELSWLSCGRAPLWMG